MHDVLMMSDRYSRKRGPVCPLRHNVSQRNDLRARRMYGAMSEHGTDIESQLRERECSA
jgi:hypothetical protein